MSKPVDWSEIYTSVLKSIENAWLINVTVQLWKTDFVKQLNNYHQIC